MHGTRRIQAATHCSQARCHMTGHLCRSVLTCRQYTPWDCQCHCQGSPEALLCTSLSSMATDDLRACFYRQVTSSAFSSLMPLVALGCSRDVLGPLHEHCVAPSPHVAFGCLDKRHPSLQQHRSLQSCCSVSCHLLPHLHQQQTHILHYSQQ